MGLQVVRHGDLVGEFVPGAAPVYPSDALIVEILNGVPVGGEHVLDVFRALDGRSMVRNQRFGLEGAQRVQPLGPDHRVAELGAPQRVDVGERHALNGIRRDQHLFLRQPDDALIVRFARHMNDLQPDSGEIQVEFVAERRGRLDEPGFAAAGRGADGAAVAAGLAVIEMGAELERPAPRPDGGEQAPVPQHGLGQVLVGDDVHLAAADVLLGHETEDAADVIAVIVGQDHRLDGLVGDFPEGGRRVVARQLAAQGVDQDDAVGSLDHGAVGAGVAIGRVDIVAGGQDFRLLVQRHLRCKLGMHRGLDPGAGHGNSFGRVL